MNENNEAKAFRALRLSLGLSAEKCSRVIRVSKTTIWRWESGASPCPTWARVMLARAMAVQDTGDTP